MVQASFLLLSFGAQAQWGAISERNVNVNRRRGPIDVSQKTPPRIRRATLTQCQKFSPEQIRAVDFSGCATTLENEARRQSARWERKAVFNPQANEPNGEEWVQPYTFPNFQFTGGAGLYGMQENRSRLQILRSTFSGLRRFNADLQAENVTEWETNCGVYSCEEYVFEKFYDYEIFDRDSARFRDDPRAVYDYAFAEGGIALRAPQQLDGTQISADFGFSNAQPVLKNDYFAFRPSAIPLEAIIASSKLKLAEAEARAPFAFILAANPSVVGVISPGFLRGIRSDFPKYAFSSTRLALLAADPKSKLLSRAFHIQANAELAAAAISDAELAYWQEHQRSFTQLIERRERLAEAIRSDHGRINLLFIVVNATEQYGSKVDAYCREYGCSVTGRVTGERADATFGENIGFNNARQTSENIQEIYQTRRRIKKLLRELYNIDQEIDWQLNEAQSAGCLNATLAGGFDRGEISRCDWAPELFAKTAREQRKAA